MQTIQDELARIYADRELNRLDLLRGCATARDAGLLQEEIAQRLQISQAEVSRILKKIRNFPELLDESPREIVLDFHAGKIVHEAMLEKLKKWPYTFAMDAEPTNPEGVLTAGSWDDILDAFHRDLLDIKDYEEIRQEALGNAVSS